MINLDNALRWLLFIALVALVTTIGVAIILLVYRHLTRQQRARNFAALEAHKVDSISGNKFEIFLEHLLTTRGFKVKRVGSSGDSGIDLVATKDGKSYAIQAKRYKKKVPKSALYEAVSGRHHRKCDYAMVITNSYFTNQGLQYARETGCKLVDRDALAKWTFELRENN